MKQCICILLLFITCFTPCYAAKKTIPKHIVNDRNVLTQDMISRENTKYTIKYEFDLEGKEIVIPSGCTLRFKKNGCIRNGIIIFNDTRVENPRFSELIKAEGKIIAPKFNSADYDFYDDTDKLQFLLSQLDNDCELLLESRTYIVNSLKYKDNLIYDDSFVCYNQCNRISINGNGAVIQDSSNKNRIGNGFYSLMKFTKCSNVSIRNLSYTWIYESVLHPKVEGIIFIRTIDECSNFDLDVSVNNAGRGIYSGNWNYYGDAGRGLCDSHIKVKANKVGYPIAIEKGDNLQIENYFNIAHRGTYLAGVTNSKVYVEGKDAYSTNVNLLMTDTHDVNGSYFCDNIDVTVVDCGSGSIAKGPIIMCQCNTYSQDYSQFKGRKPYNVNNIRLHLKSDQESSMSFEGFLCTDMAGIGDFFNVTIDGEMNDSGTNSRLCRIRQMPAGNFTFKNVKSKSNYIIINDYIPDNCTLIFEECDNIEFSEKEQIKTSGKVVFNNCSFKRYSKSKSDNIPHIIINTNG